MFDRLNQLKSQNFKLLPQHFKEFMFFIVAVSLETMRKLYPSTKLLHQEIR